MKSDKRNIIAIVLCVVFYLVYTQYLRVKYPDMDKPKTSSEVASSTDSVSNSTNPAPSSRGSSTLGAPEEQATNESEKQSNPQEEFESLAQDELTIASKTSTFVFDQRTGGIRTLKLRDYKVEPENGAMPVNLVDQNFLIQATVSGDHDRGYQGYHARRESNTIRFWKTVGSWEVSHTYIIPEDGYGAEIHFSWKNLGKQATDLTASILMREAISTAEEAPGGFLPGMPTARPTLVNSYGDDEVVREDLRDYCQGEEMGTVASVRNATIQFYGFDRHYFQKVLIPDTKNLSLEMRKLGPERNALCDVIARASQQQGLVGAGQTVTLKYQAWFGPKEMEKMQAFSPKLRESMDLGWFGFLARPLFSATSWAHDLTGNWGVAIILITLALKILFFPLNKQAAVSMKRMQKLQPEMTKIREKYKDDKQTQQQELMKFMSAHKVNPMKGCLPILPQMPIFFAFYRLLGTSVELRHAPFFGWIQDLSAADPFYVTPILLGAAMFAQQKLTPTGTMDPAQAKMMLMMPLIFTVMMLSLPAGLVLYMLANTIVSVAQQQWINRRLA